MPCLHSPCRGSWRGRRSWREMPALPMPLRGGSSLLIIFEKAPPQHVLLVLGYLEDCSSGRGKLQGKMNQRHHIPSLSLNYVDISIPLFQKVPPGSCPRHDGKKETVVGLCNLTNRMDSGGTKPPFQADSQAPKGGIKLQTECRRKCYSHPARRLAPLPGAASLAPLHCDPSARQSTKELSRPANKIRLLMASLQCSMPSGILLPKPRGMDVLQLFGQILHPKETEAELCPKTCGRLV